MLDIIFIYVLNGHLYFLQEMSTLFSWVFYFLEGWVLCSLYILGISPLSSSWEYFFPFCRWSPHSAVCFHCCTEACQFDVIHLLELSIMSSTIKVLFKKPLPMPMSSWVLPIFSCGRFRFLFVVFFNLGLLGVVMHICIPAFKGLRQEDHH